MPASLLARLWRRLPTGLRRRVWLCWHATRRAVLPLRVRSVWRSGALADAEGGVAVVGLFGDTRGVGQAARLFASALERDGVRVIRIDAGPALGAASTLPSAAAPPASGVAQARTVVTCLNPPELMRWLDVTGARALRGRRHIGYWAWELPDAPRAWAPALRFVDAVWCHSEFAADALRKLAAGRTPVHALRLPVFMTVETAPDRARFGLPDEACIVLAAMDLRSTSARKNPLGALAAYCAAAPEPDGRALLVCKLSGAGDDTATMRIVTDAAALRRDIVLLTGLLSESEMTSLIASADIVLSLHRAEGFGLLPAEASWLGRAVVATGWSAPTEFLDPGSAILVDWRPIPVEDAQGLYGGDGATWADPDIDKAAAALARLIADRALRTSTGARAAEHARIIFDPPTWSARARVLLDSTADAG